MPELKQRILDDLKTAQKQRDKAVISALRMLLSEIKNLEIEKKGELTDEAVTELLMSAAKKRQESAEQFGQAGRTDLEEKERRELELIQTYLPEQLSEEELREKVRTAISAAGASDPKDIGRVMGVVMKEVKGRADGERVSEIAKQELST